MTHKFWKNTLFKIIDPVLDGFANKTIKKTFDIKYSPLNTTHNNVHNVVFIELFCRTMLGISTCFNILEDYQIEWIIKSFNNCFSGYIKWECKQQILVEMANLSLAFIRCPRLWDLIDTDTRENILSVMKNAITEYEPYNNNWLLFTCTINIFLHKQNKITSLHNINDILDKFDKDFYIGDGWYKDGDIFHMDYYNSYVILPFLLDIYKELNDTTKYDLIVKRIQRQSEFLERLISPIGTYPLFGRSMVYRTAIFHALVYSSYLNILPSTISYAQVRCGLTSVIENTFSNEDNYTENGFLTLGFSDNQPELVDWYSNSGSVYFCLLVFIPLGLSDQHKFWSESDKKWTQYNAWNKMGKIRKDKILIH